MDTREEKTESLGLKAQWKTAFIHTNIQEALANLTNEDHIVHRYYRNPSPETLKELVQWHESCHAKWQQEAPRQLHTLERMRGDIEAHLLRCDEEADEARARGDDEAAGKCESKRQNYESMLRMVEMQVESTRETLAHIEKAICLQKENRERQKARVAALFPPTDLS